MAVNQSDILAIDDLHFGYERSQPILRGVSASLGAGRLCVLIGPNAAGKSTLLRLILAQLTPDSGTVRVMGEPVAAMKPRRRASLVSYVPQRAGVGFAFSVEQVVSMGRYAQVADPGAVGRALQACDLGDLRQRIFTQLSFGQQQRVLLARAMAQASGSGRLMLLDEPGSAMDLWHVHHMMAVLRGLTTAGPPGIAALVVLHDLNLAARYADEVWLMHEGKLIAAGPWQQVLVPAILEPVYRVGLRPMTVAGSPRPVFAVEPEGAAAAQGTL